MGAGVKLRQLPRVCPLVHKIGQVNSRHYATEGAQFVIPGAEQIGTGELLMRKMAKPIRPRTHQRVLAGTALVGARLQR